MARLRKWQHRNRQLLQHVSQWHDNLVAGRKLLPAQIRLQTLRIKMVMKRAETLRRIAPAIQRLKERGSQEASGLEVMQVLLEIDPDLLNTWYGNGQVATDKGIIQVIVGTLGTSWQGLRLPSKGSPRRYDLSPVEIVDGTLVAHVPETVRKAFKCRRGCDKEFKSETARRSHEHYHDAPSEPTSSKSLPLVGFLGRDLDLEKLHRFLAENKWSIRRLKEQTTRLESLQI